MLGHAVPVAVWRMDGGGREGCIVGYDWASVHAGVVVGRSCMGLMSACGGMLGVLVAQCRGKGCIVDGGGRL